MGAYADNADACVKGWVNLGSADADANTVSIAAVGSDGYDRVYTLAVNEATRFGGFLKLYRALPDGTGQVSTSTVVPSKCFSIQWCCWAWGIAASSACAWRWRAALVQQLSAPWCPGKAGDAG